MVAKREGRLTLAYTVLVLVILLVSGIILYYALSILHLIPITFDTYIKVVIVGLVGYLAIYIIGRGLRQLLFSRLGARASPVFFVFRVVSYILLIAIMLAVAGVSPTALVAGGTFAGLVVGLASQTVLSNVFAGLLILFARPFSVGDRVTAFGWQYGASFPYYSPKFYSDDRLIPGLTGKIVDITLNYTTILLDEGVEVKIPNNVVITMGFIIQEVDRRWVKIRFEVSPSLVEGRLEEFVELVREEVKNNEWVIDPDSVKVYVEAVTQSSVLLKIDALCRGAYEDPPRSSILKTLVQAKRRFATALKPETNP